MDVEKVPMVIFNQDNSITSRDFLNKLSGNRYFEFVKYVDSYRDLQSCIDNGKASLAIVIPNDFAKVIMRKNKYSSNLRWF